MRPPRLQSKATLDTRNTSEPTATPALPPATTAGPSTEARADGYSFPERSMMARLVEWGNIMLRGASGMDRPVLFESDEGQRKPVWSGDQRIAAQALHMLIVELPEVRLTILLQVMYREPEVSAWDDVPVPRQRRLLWEWSRECNARITTASRERRIVPIYVQAGDMMRQRDRAVRMLIAAERNAQGGAILTGGAG